MTNQDNPKLTEQSKSGFKQTINWNKYQSKKLIQAQKNYLDYLGDSYLLFFFSFWFYCLKLIILSSKILSRILSSNKRKKDYKIMIDGRKMT